MHHWSVSTIMLDVIDHFMAVDMDWITEFDGWIYTVFMKKNVEDI